MRNIVSLLLMAGLLITAGCIESTNIVNLKADGSGEITSTSYMSAAALEMISSMGGPNAEAQKNPMMDKVKAAAKAAEMGEGVQFVSIEEVTKQDGSKGAKAVYSFTDISKVKFPMNGSDTDAAGNRPGSAKPKTEKAFVTFDYTKGNLTINIPHEKDGSPVKKPESPEPENPMAKQMMMSMMHMMKGMRVSSIIALPSEIKSTNASYVGVNTGTKKKQYITLMDFNMDKLLDQPDGMEKLMAMQNGGSETEMMQMIKNIPGIKIETRETINVKF